MPKHNIMRVSGWLPVSYSVYKAFEKQVYFENVIKTKPKEDIFYNVLKFTADYLLDNPKATNGIIIPKIKKILKEYKITKFIDSQIKSWIDFIRDSFIIYYDTIKQEREDTIAAVLT